MEFQQCLWNLFAPCTSTCFFDWQEDKCYLVAHLASPNAGKDRKMLPPSGAGICSILPTCRGVCLTRCGERAFRNARRALCNWDFELPMVQACISAISRC